MAEPTKTAARRRSWWKWLGLAVVLAGLLVRFLRRPDDEPERDDFIAIAYLAVTAAGLVILGIGAGRVVARRRAASRQRDSLGPVSLAEEAATAAAPPARAERSILRQVLVWLAWEGVVYVGALALGSAAFVYYFYRNPIPDFAMPAAMESRYAAPLSQLRQLAKDPRGMEDPYRHFDKTEVGAHPEIIAATVAAGTWHWPVYNNRPSDYMSMSTSRTIEGGREGPTVRLFDCQDKQGRMRRVLIYSRFAKNPAKGDVEYLLEVDYLMLRAGQTRRMKETVMAEPKWIDARKLTIEGKGWADTEGPYDRLPARAKDTVPVNVWNLGRHSAGIAVRFRTDATAIDARWKMTDSQPPLDHMPLSGCCGLDLYVRDAGGRWRWTGIGRATSLPECRATLVAGLAAGPVREFCLYLPLYNQTVSLELAVAAPARLLPAPPRKQKPIVFYGTSIVHGGCALRPGMSYVNILGRRLDWPLVNMGFSGNGRSEPEVAELVAELDAAAFVLDPLPNMGPDDVRQRIEPFVRKLRGPRSDGSRQIVPIVLVENIPYTHSPFVPGCRDYLRSNNAELRAAYDRLTAAGTTALHYVPSAAMLGDDGEACVNGIHPTDLGFSRMADVLAPILRPLLVR